MNAVSDLFAAILGRFGYVGRARGRANIKEDLDLLGELRESPEFGSDSPALLFLSAHITSEVARYSGAEPAPKKPWGAIFLAFCIGASLALFTFTLNSDGFDWFSVIPGAGALLMIVAMVQLFTGDEDTGPDSIVVATGD